jgi:hypothetical protein
MAYEKLNDVKAVSLGGVDKKTGKKNPVELEGYYIRKEEKPNKFNPTKPQSFYVFETKDGPVGLFGKAGIDREMKKANVGVMTKVVDTGKLLDTGKGNPMRVFEVFQDSSNTIDVAQVETSDLEYADESEADDEESTVHSEPVRAPSRPASVNPSAAQSLLSKVRSRV